MERELSILFTNALEENWWTEDQSKDPPFLYQFWGGDGCCQMPRTFPMGLAPPPLPPPAGACLRMLEAHLTLAPCHGCAQRAWDPPIFAGACLEMPGGAPDLCPFHRRAQTAWYPPILLGLAWRCLEAHLTFLGKRIHLVLEILYKKAWICSSKAV